MSNTAAGGEMDLSKIPLALNPNGSPPNFIDPPSLEPAFLGVGISLITLSAILLSIRILANYKHAGKLWVDDCKYKTQSNPILLAARDQFRAQPQVP